MRSTASNILGLHLQDLDNTADFADLQVKNFTVLHSNAKVIPAIHQVIPDAVCCLRMIFDSDPGFWDWTAQDPRQVAGKANAYARQYLLPTDFVTPANEMNLSGEMGNKQPNMQTIYQQIGAWSAAFADEWRRLGSYCGIVSPALSPGHSEDQPDIPGIVGYQIMQAAWDKYDLIGVHDYWEKPGSPQLYDPKLARYYANRNVETYRNYWPTKPAWMGEWNCGGWINDSALWPQTAKDYEFFIREMASLPWVRAITHFVWDSFTQPYQVARVPILRNLFKSIAHEQGDTPVPNPPIVTPSPTPNIPMPVVFDAAGNPSNNPAQFYAVQALYGFEVAPYSAGQQVYLKEVHQSPDGQLELRADGPADRAISISWPGGTVQPSLGHAAVVFGPDSYAFPNGNPPRPGVYTVTCGDAQVSKLAWLGETNHLHVNLVFDLVANIGQLSPPVPPPTPEPPAPPAPDQSAGYDCLTRIYQAEQDARAYFTTPDDAADLDEIIRRMNDIKVRYGLTP